METTRGCCGLDERTCGLYCEKDPGKRREVVRQWMDKATKLGNTNEAELFEQKLKEGDEALECDGCKSDCVFGLCALCLVSACSQEKQLESCRECLEKVGCEKLGALHQNMPEAKRYIQGKIR